MSKTECKSSPLCSHNTNGRDLDKPCSVAFKPTEPDLEAFKSWKDGTLAAYIRKVEKEAYERGKEETLREAIRVADGFKEVDKTTLEEKPHEESCCNETIDMILATLTAQLKGNEK